MWSIHRKLSKIKSKTVIDFRKNKMCSEKTVIMVSMNSIFMAIIYRLNVVLTILGEWEDGLSICGGGAVSVIEY